jgi:hypothetical protein
LFRWPSAGSKFELKPSVFDTHTTSDTYVEGRTSSGRPSSTSEFQDDPSAGEVLVAVRVVTTRCHEKKKSLGRHISCWVGKFYGK